MPSLTLAAPPTPPADLAESPQHALPAGTRLDEFEIVRVLGAGGFGIVYLALDQILLRYVAIKEFMPTALAGRVGNGAVVARSGAMARTFEAGLESFYNEGRLLARYDHPSLVKVFRFWKANGTAYMAMQYYPGQTLKEARAEMTAPPSEEWLRAFVDPLLGALDVLHAEGVFHRDIAPDNILLLPDGRPVLLDFGSARRVIGDHTQSLTAILKPNFSPVEQYADEVGMRQGAYTDLYALGGTVCFMLTGQAPTPAVMRAVRDSSPVLAAEPADRFPGVSTEFLATIDWTLAVSPDDRPQSVEQMRDALRGATTPPPPSVRHSAVKRDDAEQSGEARIAQAQKLPSPTMRTADSEAFASTIVVPRASGDAAPPPSVTGRGGRRLRIVAAGVFIAATAAAAWGLLMKDPGSAPRAPVEVETLSSSETARPPAPALVPVTTSAAQASAASQATAIVPASPAPNAVSAKASHAPTHAKPVEPLRAAVRDAPPAAAVNALPAYPKASEVLCADMNVFARAACLNRSCRQPQLQAHPQCVEARRIVEQRQRRMEQ
jgi:serine/threonine protein kinase